MDDRPVPAPAATVAVLGSGPAPGPTAGPARRMPAEWELSSALDDQPIGTIDYDADGAELPANVQAALERPLRPDDEQGNARTRRMREMHAWRDGEDRRSLRRRMRLTDDDGF